MPGSGRALQRVQWNEGLKAWVEVTELENFLGLLKFNLMMTLIILYLFRRALQCIPALRGSSQPCNGRTIVSHEDTKGRYAKPIFRFTIKG
jgi:hypothetical protein